MKRITVLLLALLLAASALFGCDNTADPAETNSPAETKVPGETTDNAKDEIDRSGDYTYNPRLLSAYRVNDTTIRVKFSAPVAGQQHILTKSIVACADMTFQTRVPCTEAYPVNAKANDAYTLLLSDTWEFLFGSKLPADPVICITEPEKYNNGDPVMEKIFSGAYGEGLYGTSKYGALNAEIVKCSAEKIDGDKDKRPHVLWAEITNVSRGIGQIKFSEPVTCLIGNLASHMFVSDNADPVPGAGTSWQVGTANAVPVDGQSKGGKIYASLWQFAIGGAPMTGCGVIRISENDKGAQDEWSSGNNDDTLGRVLVGISGQPVRADVYSGWDVCFGQFDVTDIIG